MKAELRRWLRPRGIFAATMVAAIAFIAVRPSSPQSSTVSKTSNRSSPSEKFAELSEQFIKESLALSPVNASQAGYHKHLDPQTGRSIELDALLDDMSAETAAKQREFYALWRMRFQNETPPSSLDPEDAADWQLIDDQIGLALLDYDQIKSDQHNPTGVVELIGNAIFLPLTQNYAPKEVRLGHVLSRIREIPRALKQAKLSLSDSDPIFIKTAIEENAGNVELIEHTVANEIPTGSPLNVEYDRVASPAVAALQDFSRWLKNDLGKRPTSATWRLGKNLYDKKFRLVMETNVTPEQVLADAERDLAAVRAEMFELALPMHKQMYADHNDHSNLAEHERQNLIIGEVLDKIADDHPGRDQMQSTIQADLDGIIKFIRDKKIVSLGSLDNLKVIPTPVFMRVSYSVAGFHSAPPLEPHAEAEYWVTPIDPSTPDDQVESKLREYNNFTLQWLSIHEALPGHYVQFEHLNQIRPERRRLLRSLFSNGAYVEGWAEYIAQVMMDEGFLNNDPRFRMVMRKIRLRVLANAILDIRMQTMEMTDAQALELMTKEAFQTRAEADGKLTRAKLTATQLPTYYVGIREWLAFRKDYQAAAGKKFNLMKFHDLALDQGPLPVPVVEKLLMPAPKQ